MSEAEIGAENQPVTGWQSLLFDGGEASDEWTDVLLRFDGHVTLRGATDRSVKRALKMMLEHVDLTAEYETEAEEPWSDSDQTIEEGEYVIAYNRRARYVALYRRVGTP